MSLRGLDSALTVGTASCMPLYVHKVCLAGSGGLRSKPVPNELAPSSVGARQHGQAGKLVTDRHVPCGETVRSKQLD